MQLVKIDSEIDRYKWTQIDTSRYLLRSESNLVTVSLKSLASFITYTFGEFIDCNIHRVSKNKQNNYFCYN